MNTQLTKLHIRKPWHTSHKISKQEVLKFRQIIADMLALNTSSFTIEEIAKEISDRVLN